MKKPLPISNSRGGFGRAFSPGMTPNARDLPWRASQIAPPPKFKTLGNSKP
jgi:hypothetical protein